MRVCIAQNVSLSDHLALSTYLRNIAKYLAELKDVELTIVALKGRKLPTSLLKKADILLVRGDLYSLSGNVKYSLELLRVLREIYTKKGIDVIHCLYPNSSLLPSVLLKKLRNAQFKIIYDI